MHDDIPAALRQRERNRAADTPGCAGDEGNFSLS
jgi:hypothetical protein